jgi:hypothetical protein
MNRGQSTSTGRGDFTYSDRTEDATGFWTESAGTFRRDGSGGTRTSSSDGYATDYTFNADGSGPGHDQGQSARPARDRHLGRARQHDDPLGR